MRKGWMVIALLLVSAPAFAATSGNQTQSSGPEILDVKQPEPIGVGLIFNGLIGVNALYYLMPSLAIDGTFGGNIWSFKGGSDGLHIDVDAMWRSADMIQVKKGLLEVYAGGGLGFNRWAAGVRPFRIKSRWGELRFPVGAQYYLAFKAIPVSFFAEIVPKMMFTKGSSSGDGTFDLGARVHFGRLKDRGK